MERYRRLLSDTIVDIPIRDVVVNREKSINVPAEDFRQQVAGTRVIYVERRGKHLIFHLSSGRRLLLHLMLGGLLYLVREGEERPARSVQVELHFGSSVLCFIGLRLGYLHLLTAKETDFALKELGPELLDRRMNKERFVQLLQKRRGAVKSILVNQNVVAGIGNCYADEIAFDAHIHPASKIQSLAVSELEQLYDSTVKVLEEAVEGGGYMEMPFYSGDELTGSYNDHCKVYDRGGEPCVRCGTPITKTEKSGRKVFFCPNCQHEK